MTRPATSYGQFHVAESPSSLNRLHLHDGTPLKTVDHEPKVGVLDQEDLFAQGIDTSKIVKGAKRVDALGSCTANAGTSAVSNVLGESAFLELTKAKTYDDVVAAEEWAILFYHLCSDLTGDPTQEYPPVDCGSTGQYVTKEMVALKLAAGEKIAHGATNIVSLMQTDGLMMGSPFFNAWEEPGPDGFVDGKGTPDDLKRAIASGVAGGHETYLSSVEKLTLLPSGLVDPTKTVVRDRNSWSKSWGDHGSFRLHLSTLVMLGNYVDLRQLQAA